MGMIPKYQARIPNEQSPDEWVDYFFENIHDLTSFVIDCFNKNHEVVAIRAIEE